MRTRSLRWSGLIDSLYLSETERNVSCLGVSLSRAWVKLGLYTKSLLQVHTSQHFASKQQFWKTFSDHLPSQMGALVREKEQSAPPWGDRCQHCTWLFETLQQDRLATNAVVGKVQDERVGGCSLPACGGKQERDSSTQRSTPSWQAETLSLTQVRTRRCQVVKKGSMCAHCLRSVRAKSTWGGSPPPASL